MSANDINPNIQAPDFGAIRAETGVLTSSALQMMWTALNGELANRAQGDKDVWLRAKFNAPDFTMSGLGTWVITSGEVTDLAYRLHGRTLLVSWALQGFGVGGFSSPELRIGANQWGNYSIASRAGAATYYSNPCICANNSGAATQIGYAQALTGTAYISLFLAPPVNWALSVTNSSCWGQLQFEVNI